MLILDAGHGGKDGGAQGNGISEKEYTLKISKYQYDRFKALGVPVKMTRTKDVTLDPNKRAPLVKNSGATYCISNHINAGGGEGFEIITSIFDPNPPLAEYIRQEMTAAGQPFRRIFTRKSGGRDYYYMHRNTGAVKTLIMEYGFLDNARDAARLKANWKTYAEAVVKAYCRFIKHPYTAPNQPKTATGTPAAGNEWVVQTGAFKDRKNAEKHAADLKKKGFDSFIYRK